MVVGRWAGCQRHRLGRTTTYAGPVTSFLRSWIATAPRIFGLLVGLMVTSVLCAPHAVAGVPLADVVVASDGQGSGYTWLVVVGVTLLVLGTVGRVVGLRMMYKNRKDKNL